MKRSPAATMQRTIRRGLTWRPKARGAEPLSIRSLISPLRYDVLVRAQFFSFLDSRQGSAGSLAIDCEALVREAREQPYFVWFEKVAMARFRPWVLEDRAQLDAQFAERVTTAAALWTSFSDKGFDPSHPITLRSTTGVMRTDSGAMVSSTTHVGDGGHRLALLLASGQDVLEPQLYQVDPRPMSRLIDNTAVLAPALGLAGPAYARFLSAGYSDREFDDVSALLAHLHSEHSPRAAELEQVLAAHQRTVPSCAGRNGQVL